MTICEKYVTENNGLARVKQLFVLFQLQDNVEVFKCARFLIVIVEVTGSRELLFHRCGCLPFSLLSNLPSGATDVSCT